MDSLATKASDIFSLGMVIIEVGSDHSVIRQPPYPSVKAFAEEFPFSGMEVLSVVICIAKGGRPKRPNHPDLTKSLWRLTERCWDEVTRCRPEMGEVVEVLEELSAFNLRLCGECFAHKPS